MTDPSHSLVASVIDRSGSMSSIRSDAEGGFNTFLNDQRGVPGRTTFFTAKFDSDYEVEHDYLDAAVVGSFTLEPRGSTALLDAIGRTIVSVGAHLAATPEDQRPGKVYFVVVTDGQENASREYTRSQINDMITHQRDAYGWEFIFLAANQDAIATGAQMGFASSSSLSFAATGQGAQGSYGSLSSAVTRSRVTGQGVGYTDEERAAAMPTTSTPTPSKK